MNHTFTSPIRGSITSPSSHLSGATGEGSDFIQRSAERREAYARAHSSMVCDNTQKTNDGVLSPAFVQNLNAVSLSSKKKLEFKSPGTSVSSFYPPNSRRVSFATVDVQSITPRFEKHGAIGLCIEQEGLNIVVRSLNPDGPAAADGRIIPGDTLIAGLRMRPAPPTPIFSCVSFLRILSQYLAVNGLSVTGRTIDSLRDEITGGVGTFIELTLASCWYITLSAAVARACILLNFMCDFYQALSQFPAFFILSVYSKGGLRKLHAP
jgi:hypothetical protein